MTLKTNAQEANAGTPLNSAYTLWAVYRRDPAVHTVPAADGAARLTETLAEVTARGATVRGIYDVSGLRADADLMLWLHGSSAELLQQALRDLRRTPWLKPLLPTWNAMGLHREAEFARDHVPAFLRGEHARTWLSVYPFVRSYDWYVLPAEERKALLSEHGRKGAAFKQVMTNTVAAFSLGDYEWILPFEADDLADLVELVRDLRATGARLHVREETPFYTGRRIEVGEIAEVLR